MNNPPNLTSLALDMETLNNTLTKILQALTSEARTTNLTLGAVKKTMVQNIQILRIDQASIIEILSDYHVYLFLVVFTLVFMMGRVSGLQARLTTTKYNMEVHPPSFSFTTPDEAEKGNNKLEDGYDAKDKGRVVTEVSKKDGDINTFTVELQRASPSGKCATCGSSNDVKVQLELPIHAGKYSRFSLDRN